MLSLCVCVYENFPPNFTLLNKFIEIEFVLILSLYIKFNTTNKLIFESHLNSDIFLYTYVNIC